MRSWWRPLLLFVSCLGLFVALRILRAAEVPTEAPTLRDLWRTGGLPVETARVAQEPVQRRVRLFGTARGVEQAEVFCPSPNILEKLHVRLGQDVKAGTLLVSMRDIALSPLGYPYGPLEAKKEALDADARRLEDLRQKGAITAQDWDHFEAERKATEAQFASARAIVELTAPISGTVTRIDFRPGEMVPNDRPLLQVARIDPLAVDFMAEAADVGGIAPGQAVEVRSSAVPGATFSGEVVERALAAHPVLNQFRVRVKVANPDRTLLPGFSLTAEVRTGAPDPVLAVPVDALVTWYGSPGVWKVVDGTARFVPVVTGATDGALQAVTADLAAGDVLVTLGRAEIREDGQRLLLAPVDDAPTPPAAE